MSIKRTDGIRAGIDTPCTAFDMSDICIECVLNSVEQRQGCFKAVEKSACNSTCNDRQAYCEAVQKVLEVLCSVCGKCGKDKVKNEGKI